MPVIFIELAGGKIKNTCKNGPSFEVARILRDGLRSEGMRSGVALIGGTDG